MPETLPLIDLDYLLISFNEEKVIYFLPSRNNTQTKKVRDKNGQNSKLIVEKRQTKKLHKIRMKKKYPGTTGGCTVHTSPAYKQP